MAKYIFSTNQKFPPGKRRCTFCTNQMKDIDYKDVKTLKHFLNAFRKIKGHYYTGVCLNHQKKLSNAIKRARHMALVPFTN
ncbi:30S ribosomal protein S18 [Candidatus Peregrinibacteria bacterium]|nr:30S ribosomal protein S18 [Candidatus Peregrinibacteria bacterium]